MSAIELPEHEHLRGNVVNEHSHQDGHISHFHQATDWGKAEGGQYDKPTHIVTRKVTTTSGVIEQTFICKRIVWRDAGLLFMPAKGFYSSDFPDAETGQITLTAALAAVVSVKELLPEDLVPMEEPHE